MDVRLPDGTIVQNVPDGITQDELMARVQAAPARMSPNVAAQGEKYRANMTAPESVMDPRMPAYRQAQEGSAAMDVLGGLAGGAVGGLVKPGAAAVQGVGRWLMRSALKPNPAEDPVKAARAVETMLKRGEMVSQGGIDNMQQRGLGLNTQVADLLKQNPGAVPVSNIAGYGDDLIGKLRYTNQVDDLAAARGAKDKFLGGETLQEDLGQREAQLLAEMLTRRASGQGALQDAGRFATTRAQMEQGGQKWYPVEGMPRAPYRYSPHAEQVPAATGAMTDALVIAKQRQREVESLGQQLESLPPYERAGMVPVEQAQAMKQALYAKIGDKGYGLGLKPTAERDTYKSIAHGLRKDIETIEPRVAPLNEEAGDIWNALNIARRRVATAGNKDPVGLGTGVGLVYNPAAAIAFQGSRSEYLKSALANLLYRSGRAPGIAIGAGAGSNMGQDQ